ncbi:MAG: hypothetical protein V1889_03105 [archaeon]
MRVVLISCVSKKLDEKAKVKDLYISSLFRYNLRYACLLKPDKIFVLSAKYGLVGLDEEIEPYDKTLNGMNSVEKKKWADDVFVQLSNEIDVDRDEVIFLAGENYRKYLIERVKNFRIPLKGLGIGRQLKFLKENVT